MAIQRDSSLAATAPVADPARVQQLKEQEEFELAMALSMSEAEGPKASRTVRLVLPLCVSFSVPLCLSVSLCLSLPLSVCLSLSTPYLPLSLYSSAPLCLSAGPYPVRLGVRRSYSVAMV